MKQRDKMRELFAKYGNKKEILVREYAAAERRGEVTRARNAHKLTSEDYAQALLRDALKRGWISGLQ